MGYLLNEADPVLLMIFLFSWSVYPFANILMRIKSICFTKRGMRVTISSTEKKTETKTPSQRFRILLLLVAISLSFLVVVCPYLPFLNPKGKYVSVDAPLYESYLTMTKSLEGGELVRYLITNSERLLPILAMLVIQIATGASSGLVVKTFPLLLGPLFVLSSYYLISVATHDEERALYSALFASTSIVVTVGMFAGYYANWLSISMAMLSLAFILGYVEEGEKSKLALSCIFFTLICISHVWNWIFISAALSLYFFYEIVKVLLRRGRLDKRKLIGVSLPLATSFFILLITYIIFISGRVLLMKLTSYIKFILAMRFINFFLLIKNLNYVLDVRFAGFMSNSFYFVTATIGILTTSDEELTKFFYFLLFVTSFPFLFYDYVIQSRLLYVQPIHLMCAAGVCKIERFMRDKGLRLGSRIFVIVYILSSINYALESMLKLISLMLE